MARHEVFVFATYGLDGIEIEVGDLETVEKHERDFLEAVLQGYEPEDDVTGEFVALQDLEMDELRTIWYDYRSEITEDYIIERRYMDIKE